ncbi:glycerophosphodiester phosphodiesterase family protein [Erythrobacter sp. SCSIO 43205]|uniref:glycerophosphodiester phosphodiesterase family protein n=1 Tax=Erythrobacter sp. SCSIO 43205 TaxID=2779361 RepID=UPI002104049C|nr:glycerophosphodiester phosphodiesterase family protein [Erythrobacter sp. SCSIO 43205]
MKSIKWLALLAAGVVVTSSAQAQFKNGPWEMPTGGDLSATLDCLEAEGKTIISAHRGGPSPGLPENAIPTMDAVLHAVPAMMEIDVAASPDGVHYLMHDRTLDRTTTGEGAVTDVPWKEVAELSLVDEAGWVTPYKVPTFAETLAWAKGKTILQVDFKRTADFQTVISEIRAAEMAQGVILIAYTKAQALKLYELAPEMIISYSVNAPGDLEEIVEAGIPAENIVAFTGTRLARPDLYAALEEADVEVIFGTLGRPDRSLDAMFARFGTDERYAELGAGGVDIIATDRPRAAAIALAEAERLPTPGTCGITRGE